MNNQSQCVLFFTKSLIFANIFDGLSCITRCDWSCCRVNNIFGLITSPKFPLLTKLIVISVLFRIPDSHAIYHNTSYPTKIKAVCYYYIGKGKAVMYIGKGILWVLVSRTFELCQLVWNWGEILRYISNMLLAWNTKLLIFFSNFCIILFVVSMKKFVFIFIYEMVLIYFSDSLHWNLMPM